MSRLVKFGSILGTICLAATIVLAVTHEVARPVTAAHPKAEEHAALTALMPLADSFVEKSLDGIGYYDALKGKTVIGYCVRVTGNGYSGCIRIMAGIDPDGIIRGISILEHSETPGIGSKINEVKPGENEPWFLRQFKGKDARTIALKRDIDAITGATISSSAVTEAINKTVNSFMSSLSRHKLELGEKQKVGK